MQSSNLASKPLFQQGCESSSVFYSGNTASRYCAYTDPTPSLPTPDISTFRVSFNPEHYVDVIITIQNLAAFPSGCNYNLTISCPAAGSYTLAMGTNGTLAKTMHAYWSFPNIKNGMAGTIKLMISKSGYSSMTSSFEFVYNY